jgi:anaerobic magnesium-protoporphyrin IX monomethyl ester cyclase
MRALLVSPPWGQLYGDFRAAARVGVAYPPLGLCYLASALKAAGHEALVLDAEAEGLGAEGVLARAQAWRADLIGIQVVSPLWDAALEIGRLVRERAALPVVIGGPHVSITAEEALEQNPYADYGVLGEGEDALAELATCLERGGDPASVTGLVFRRAGAIQCSAPRETRAELDELPLPERGDLAFGRYLFSVPGKGIRPFTTILSSRGCPFECTFCTEPAMFGRRTRFRSAEAVADEIEQVNRRHGVTHFVFVDDTLTVNRQRIERMCEEILRRGLRVTLEGWTHANTVDEELLRTLRSAGLVRLSFGVESGNPGILRTLKKGTDHERIRAAYRAAKSAGIETRGSVILGLPGDTRATVEDTIRFVSELDDLDHCYFNIAMPYPGTEMRADALAGRRGTRLLTREYSQLRRQGQRVVMEVNDLDTPTLLALQRSAYRRFWLRPRRILYNLRRAGPAAAARNGVAFFQSFVLPRRTPRTAFASEITAIAEH